LGRKLKLPAARALYFAGANLSGFESRRRCNPRGVNRSGTETATFNFSRVASSLRTSNGEAERPAAAARCALRAHNNESARGALHCLSRSLQHLVRRPPHRSPLCARGNLRAIKAASLKVKRATLRFEPDQGCLRFAHLAISDTNQSHAGARPEPTYTDTVPTKAAVSLQDLGRNTGGRARTELRRSEPARFRRQPPLQPSRPQPKWRWTRNVQFLASCQFAQDF